MMMGKSIEYIMNRYLLARQTYILRKETKHAVWQQTDRQTCSQSVNQFVQWSSRQATHKKKL